MRLDHLCTNCKPGERDKVIEFYEKLGFVVYKIRHGGLPVRTTHMEHKTDRSLKMDIYERPEESFNASSHIGNHIGLLVDDVQRVYEDWKKAGVDFGDAKPPWLNRAGKWVFNFRAPNGLWIQLSSEMRKEEYISDYAITEGKKLERAR